MSETERETLWTQILVMLVLVVVLHGWLQTAWAIAAGISMLRWAASEIADSIDKRAKDRRP